MGNGWDSPNLAPLAAIPYTKPSALPLPPGTLARTAVPGALKSLPAAADGPGQVAAAERAGAGDAAQSSTGLPFR